MSTDERIVKLESQQKDMRYDINEIKVQVSNHIPTSINECKNEIRKLRDSHIASQAVRDAIFTSIRNLAYIMAIVWTLVRMIEVFKQ